MSERRTDGDHLRRVAGEHPGDQLAGVGIVLDDEDPDAGEIGDGEAGLAREVAPGVGGGIGRGVGPRFQGRRRERRERQADGEDRPLPGAGARRLDRAAVQLDQMADDGEAEAEATVLPARRGVGLAEALEDVGEELRLDPHPGVGDDDLDVRVDPRDEHLDLPPLGGELDGVGEQVPDHLLEAVGVASDRPQRVEDPLQADPLGLGGGADRFERRLDQRHQLDRPHVEPHLPRGDARDVQEVLDELGLGVDAPRDGRQAAVDDLRFVRTETEHLRPAEDGVQGGPQLVREGGEELVLGPVCPLGLVPCLLRPGEETPVLLLGLLALGDVDAGADVASEGPLRGIARHAVVEEPAVLAVGPPEAELHAKALAGVERGGIDAVRAVEVVRMDLRGPALADLLFHRAAGELQPGAVEPVAAPVGRRHPDEDGGAVGGNLEALLALLQGARQPLPLPPVGLDPPPGGVEAFREPADHHPDDEKEGDLKEVQGFDAERPRWREVEIVGEEGGAGGRQKPGTQAAEPGARHDGGKEEEEGDGVPQQPMEGQPEGDGEGHGSESEAVAQDGRAVVDAGGGTQP